MPASQRLRVGLLTVLVALATLAGCGGADVSGTEPPATSTPPASADPAANTSPSPSLEPTASAEPKPTEHPAGDQVREVRTSAKLRIGETARFPYFDVTVHEERHRPNDVEGGSIHGYRVTVCYTKQHPGARPDGSTRTSVNPWTIGLTHDLVVNWVLPAKYVSSYWKPAYPERILHVGECNTGWITLDIREGVFLSAVGIRYDPADFDFSATWRSKRG